MLLSTGVRMGSDGYYGGRPPRGMYPPGMEQFMVCDTVRGYTAWLV